MNDTIIENLKIANLFKDNNCYFMASELKIPNEYILYVPYLLSFAAGAMIYVVVEELIPESQIGKHSNLGTLCFAFGFIIMMILDVALG